MAKSKSVNNGIIYIFSSIITNLLPVISISIFTRLLSPKDYGFYSLSLIYGSFLVSICNFGLQIGYERDHFENSKKENKLGLFYTTVLFVICSTLLIGIIIFSFNEFLSKLIFNHKGYGILFLITFLYLGCTGIKNYFMIYYKNTENAKAFFLFSIIEGVISLPIAFTLIRFFEMGVLGLTLGQFSASFLILCYLIFSIRNESKIIFDIPSFLKSFKSSLPLTFKIFFGVISTNLDKILLGKIGEMKGLGVYNLGQKIGYVAFTYTLAIYNIFSPKVYKDMFDMGLDGGKQIGLYLTKFFYISIAGVLTVALFSEELIIIITPKAYHGAIEISTIFSMLYGLYFFGTIPQLIYAKKSSLSSLLSLIYIVLNFVLVFVFIPIWGPIGAAFGSLVSGVLSSIVGFYFSQKHFKIHWEYSKILTILGLLFGSSLILIFLRQLEVNFFIRFAYKILIMGILFLIGKSYQFIPEFKIRDVIFIFKNKITEYNK